MVEIKTRTIFLAEPDIFRHLKNLIDFNLKSELCTEIIDASGNSSLLLSFLSMP